jgi:superfamily II DNA helicase RecQ
MNRYFEHPQFSTLSYMKRKAVQGMIDELIRQRYLKITPGKYPTVSLSGAGEKAARERLGIPINYKAELKPSSVPGMRRVASQRVTDTVDETRQLLVQGMGAQEIADVRGLKIGTIFNHLASLIEQEKIAVEDVVDEQERQLIEAAVQEVGSFYLSPIKARLPEEVSYGEIRCVVAWMQKQEQLAIEPLSQQNVLMERLREWRTKRAEETGIRSHIIFSNAVLHAIAEAMPRSLDGLLAVRGVSQDKCQQYGAEILAIVSNATGKAILREARESYVTSQSDHSSSISSPQQNTEANDTLPSEEASGDSKIFDQLRQWRSNVAKETGVPAYVVLNNATLEAIVKDQPRSQEELLQLPGIGPAKSQLYGEAVLAIISQMREGL